jgi:hypothetical protein
MRAFDLVASAIAIACVVATVSTSYGDGGVQGDGGVDSGLPPDSGTCTENDFSECASPGSMGCGGFGGAGGGGGQGGGASIALFATGATSTVNVTNGGFFAVQGGPGGPGVGGAAGASGDAGATGPAFTPCFKSCEAGCANVPLSGGSGGPGGSGGAGGSGGGGMGGPTYFYAAANNAIINVTQSTLDASAFLGTPSQPGAPNGADGVQAVHP